MLCLVFPSQWTTCYEAGRQRRKVSSSSAQPKQVPYSTPNGIVPFLYLSSLSPLGNGFPKKTSLGNVETCLREKRDLQIHSSSLTFKGTNVRLVRSIGEAASREKFPTFQKLSIARMALVACMWVKVPSIIWNRGADWYMSLDEQK